MMINFYKVNNQLTYRVCSPPFENPKSDFSILTSLFSGQGWGGERLGRGVC